MRIRWAGIWSMVALGLVAAGSARDGGLRIEPGWVVPFAGTRTSMTIFETAHPEGYASVGWELVVGRAVVARGEHALDARDGGPRSVRIEFDLPPVRADVALDGVVRAWRLSPDRGVGSPVERRFPLLGDNPFQEAGAELRALRIVLFDPDGPTAEALESLGIPFVQTSNLAAVPEMNPGLFLVAEGLSFRDFRALPEAMLRMAEAGVPTLCLAPLGGDMEWPIEVPGVSAVRLTIADRGIVRDLDKRLAEAAWGEAGAPVRGSLALRSYGGRPVLEASEQATGWPWIEMQTRDGAALAICGFAIVSPWDRTPAARWLLRVLLEKSAGTAPDRSGSGRAVGRLEETR